VFTLGFLPTLSYVKPALIARRPLEQKADADRVAAERLAAAAADQPLATSAVVSTAIDQAVHAGSDQEMLERSHNPWLYPAGIRDRLLTPLKAANVSRVESVRHGVLTTAVDEAGVTVFTLPLDASDFVMVTHEPHELRVGKLQVGKVLFLGNSITLHGPAPQIGWTGNWGMAASARGKDFVHRLLDRIASAAGGEPRVMARNIADFVRGLSAFNIREHLKDELAFKPDVIILAIGENSASPTTDESCTQFTVSGKALLRQKTEAEK